MIFFFLFWLICCLLSALWKLLLWCLCGKISECFLLL